jgi:hypothetical protein
MKKLVVLLLFLSWNSSVWSQNEMISLQNESIEINVDGFYIKDVVDVRENKENIGFVQKGVFKKTKIDANLKGGVEKCIFDYLKGNFSQNKNGVPIVLHVTKLEISETKSLPISGKAEIEIEFFRERDGSLAKLYQSEAFVEQPALNVTKTHEARIREVIATCLQSFNESDWKTLEPVYFKEKNK